MASAIRNELRVIRFSQQIYDAKFVQEGNIFPALFVSRESELLLHVKHSAVKQNSLQVKTC